MEHARMIAAQRQAKDDEIERLTKENEELRQRLAVEEAHSDKYRCENEELRAALKAKQESAEPDKYLSKLHGLPVYIASTEAIENFKRRVLELISRVEVPVGNSAAGEMACEWTMKVLRDVHDEIATLPLIEEKLK